MNSTSKSNSLMGDLESIKALLEEDDLEPVPEALSQALNPPVPTAEPSEVQEAEIDHELDEAIDRAIDEVRVNESLITSEPLVTNERLETNERLVTNASLDALLGEDFHDATAEVMQRARGLINQHANEWSPQQTDELADALRVRIDSAVEQWIQTSLAAHAGELQTRLLTAVRSELARHLEAFESN